MKKIGLLLITVIFMIPVFVFAASNAPIPINFYKIDEQERIVNNAEFILRDLNNKYQREIVYNDSKKVYSFLSRYAEDYSTLVDILPPSAKEIVSSFRKMEDFEPYNINVSTNGTISNFKDVYVECNYVGSNFMNHDTNGYFSIQKLQAESKYKNCFVTVPTIMFIEETLTPPGLKKETIVIPSNIKFIYNFNQETEEISFVTSSLDFIPEPIFYDEELANFIIIDGFFRYDKTLNYSDTESVYNALNDYYADNNNDMIYPMTNCALGSSPKVNKQSSIHTKYNIRKMISDGELELDTLDCTPIITDASGHSDISIESYVNNEEEVNLTQSDTVQIKVFLKNQGSAPSYDNVVVSEVPEGVEYVEGSANANGIYNPDDRTVTWNLDYLDAHDGYIFAYDVSVTTGQTSNIYVTTSSVTSNENTTPVESNEARVTTPGMGSEDIPENPKTGDARASIIVVLLIISFSLLYYSWTKKAMKL